MWESITSFIDQIVDTESPYRRWVFSIAAFVILWLIYVVLTRVLRRYLKHKSYKPESVQNFLFLWRYLWLAVVVIVALVIGLSGSIAALGVSAAFLGMILGWSLQAPVTGIAAWLMIVLKRPFKIGDRIIVAGITGDVTDINLTHIVLNQVGGTIGGEEKSGRGVMIPNAILFQQVIYNYNFETKYVLDEVPVLITYESEVADAERILVQAAQQVTTDILSKLEQKPFVRAELADSGIRLRLRYQTLAMERQRISSEIVKRIIDEFNANPSVEFAYPHTEVLYRPKPPASAITPQIPLT